MTEPKIKEQYENGDLLSFTLFDCNVSIANAVRRIILTGIDVNVFDTERHENKPENCIISANTTRLHNEIIKQRLACIPIHQTDLSLLPDKYVLEVDVINESPHIVYITTEDFKIMNKTTNHYLKKEEVIQIFPPDKITNSFIDFARLGPKISDTIQGEQLKLKCEFSVGNAKQNSSFNVVSKCSYGNTPDMVRINEVWESLQEKYASEEMSKSDIEFEKKNFYILDAQRYFIPNSFDFVIETIGIYTNLEIMKKACIVLQNKFIDLIDLIQSDMLIINTSDVVSNYSTIENSFDITLENEDFTLGKVLEYIIYETYFIEMKTLTYISFGKFHPHNPDGVLRIAFKENVEKTVVKNYMYEACNKAQDIFKHLYKLF
jgi:DNA-directed RNA polymerase subunit L/DNA-directed RNA polymerase alpha subunit